MIKRLYLANGELLQPLQPSSDDVAVDASIAGMLATLGLSDHCYLTLINGCKLEVIKISRDNFGFHVDRGIDGTARQGFPVGTQIVYRLTKSEILDGINFNDYRIYADGSGYAYVNGGNGSWIIGAPPIHADTVGGITAYTEDNELVIQDNVGMFGCCDSSLTGAPGIDGPIFYLTSMLYGQEAIEVFTPNPKDKNGNSIPPINFNLPWYLLTQPSGVERYFDTDLQPGKYADWNIFGGQKAFTAAPEKYIRSSMGVGVYGDWNEFGGQQAFTSAAEKYIRTDCYPLQMITFGNGIEYKNGLDKYVWPFATPFDWTTTDG